MRNLVALAALLFAAAPSWAEHRKALLIGNSGYQDKSLVVPKKDLKALADRLEKAGIPCTVMEDVDDKTLRRAIEGFASGTPTRGTAIVFFSGQVLPGQVNGKPATCMLGTNAKKGGGFSVAEAFKLLAERGGSRVNIIIADSPEAPAFKGDLPDGCLLSYNAPDRITGKGDLLVEVKAGARGVTSTLPAGLTLSDPSRAISPPDRFVKGTKAGDEWVNRRGMVFVWCPPGSFTMGSPPGTPSRYPDEQQVKVTIREGFWIGKYELTLGQNLRNRPRNTIATHKNHPLTMVHWDDARAMTTRNLTQEEQKGAGLPKDWQVFLPTEEQWEYAARAGSQTVYSFGDDPRRLAEYGNFGDKSFYDSKDIYSNAAHRTWDDGAVYLAKVGSYKPNAWGLYDVHGNVAEWCANQAIKGGSWVSTAETCRSGYKHHFSSRNQQNFIGYRLVIQKAPPPKAKPKGKKK